MPHTVADHGKSPKSKRNPKPSPTGNNFGLSLNELVGQNCNLVKSRILCLRFINITIITLNTVLINRFLKYFCKIIEIIETLSYYFLYLMYKTLGSREENQS